MSRVARWELLLFQVVGYDTAVIGGTIALDSFRADFDIVDTGDSERDIVQGNIVSSFQAGCFFGALLTFPSADKLGRRITILIAAVVFIVGGTLMTAARGSLNIIIAGRAIAGLGIGSTSMCVPVYISETASPSIRGQLVGIFEIASQGGGMLGFWINYATAETIPSSSSPSPVSTLSHITLRGCSRPSVLQETSTKLFSTGLYGCFKTLGTITFTIVVVEQVGRRKGLIWGDILGCIPMFYLGGYDLRADPALAAEQGQTSRDGWGYLAMVAVYLNSFVICAAWQGITWTYASEIFPLDIRMLCVAITTAVTWLGSFVIARSTPHIITDLGYGTYFMFGSFVIGMGGWAFFCVPETKGKSERGRLQGYS